MNITSVQSRPIICHSSKPNQDPNPTNPTPPNSTIDPFCRDNPELCIGGALGYEYYSTKGAFNGSGIAVAGEAWNQGQRRIFTIYFQHWTGDIRFMQYTTDRKWIGGTKSETVASDAKNATPISTVAYNVEGTQFVSLCLLSLDARFD